MTKRRYAQGRPDNPLWPRHGHLFHCLRLAGRIRNRAAVPGLPPSPPPSPLTPTRLPAPRDRGRRSSRPTESHPPPASATPPPWGSGSTAGWGGWLCQRRGGERRRAGCWSGASGPRARTRSPCVTRPSPSASRRRKRLSPSCSKHEHTAKHARYDRDRLPMRIRVAHRARLRPPTKVPPQSIATVSESLLES